MFPAKAQILICVTNRYRKRPACGRLPGKRIAVYDAGFIAVLNPQAGRLR